MVSRGRPEALARCVLGLSQQVHDAFEIVAVADPAGLAALAGWGGRLKTVPFDEANISAARNAGIAAAAGAVVAFIDDDAVPEPLWLGHLAGAFADPRVAAAGGFVRGPDGIAWQWRGAEVRADATSRPLAADGPLRPGRAIRTEGTNMAVRAEVLRSLGGFDPGYRFWLDETDLCWRLARAGCVTRLVPPAEVHHGALPSARRRADRVALSLHEVGASLAVWGRRHGIDLRARLEAERAARRRTLLGHMVAGRIEPGDVARILATLDAGWSEGGARALPDLSALPPASAPFLRFVADPPRSGHAVMSTGLLGLSRARSRAQARASGQASGQAVTLLVMWPGVSRHRVRFAGGVWVQSGGLWGRSDGGRGALSWRARVAREAARVARVRGEGGGDAAAP